MFNPITVIAKICFTAADQDVLINVTDYLDKKGSYSRDAASDHDYLGYTLCSWFVTDENDKGIELGAEFNDAIVRTISDHFGGMKEEFPED